MKPSVGRIVHFVCGREEPLAREPGFHAAAIVTEVLTGVPESEGREVCFLEVMLPGIGGVPRKARHSEADPAIVGTWHWPEREE
jgi:hypothetical protein